MVGAVIGQLITVGLVMAEIAYSGYFHGGVLTFFEALIFIACIGALVCALLVAPSYFKQQKEVKEKLVPRLESMSLRYKTLQEHSAGFAPEEQDQELINHLIAREDVPPKWAMF